MATVKKIPEDLLEQLRRDRERIAAELPELKERGRRLEEAASEDSLSGHLRRIIHCSGRPLQKIAAEVGLDVLILCDFLQGTRTLRSDVLDRLAQSRRRRHPNGADATASPRTAAEAGDRGPADIVISPATRRFGGDNAQQWEVS